MVAAVKLSDIVKPSSPGDFIRLQVSCFEEARQHAGTERLQFLARIDHIQQHLPGKPVIELVAVYEISQAAPLQLSFLVTDRAAGLLALFEQRLPGKQMASALGVAWVELCQGLSLQPVHIPKPWGQEIWYSGIEQRGVSQVCSAEGCTPLNQVLAAAPGYVLGAASVPVLLKILDPLPDEVFGDLYFEMHEEKQEVYVVTHVDTTAWPTGKGGIRFGFNQQLRKTFPTDEQFKRAYLSAVQHYREVRQQIDAMFDEHRRAEKIGLNDPVMPEVIRRWSALVPANLLQEESRRRKAMENFIAVKPLQLGDVIRVPCFTPHSLQHGVRTVEFQTPVYERKILSFAQKVLTQAHWDTAEALAALQVDAPVESPLALLADDGKQRREEVVSFSDFRVERISWAAATRLDIAAGHYRLLLVVSGELELENRRAGPGEAVLLPSSQEFRINGTAGTVVLLAEPVAT